MQQLERSEQQHITANRNDTAPTEHLTKTKQQAEAEQQMAVEHQQQRIQQQQQSIERLRTKSGTENEKTRDEKVRIEEVLRERLRDARARYNRPNEQEEKNEEKKEEKNDENTQTYHMINNKQNQISPSTNSLMKRQVVAQPHHPDTKCENQSNKLWIDRSLMGDPHKK